jgi:hypothetical protein
VVAAIRREVHAVHPRHETVLPPAAPFPKKESHPAEKGSRYVGLVFILVGALRFSPAAEAATEKGGGAFRKKASSSSTETLRTATGGGYNRVIAGAKTPIHASPA